MNIYSQISANKWKSILLLVLFACFASVVFYALGVVNGDPTTYIVFGFIFSAASGLFSYFYSDRMVLWSTGAVPATKKEHFDFYTVAENISIAAGIPTPKLYVMQSEALNAFATGRDPKHGVVCVTTGLLAHMDRAELEGVIAHEMSHIKNYDILFASIVAVLVGTLAMVVDWIMHHMFWFGVSRDDDRDNSNPFSIIALILIMVLAPLIATIIQLAISRRREYLADSSGVLLTRNPAALADALEKLSMSQVPLKKASGGNAHMFITNPFGKGSFSTRMQKLFSTHPPIEERIRLLRAM